MSLKEKIRSLISNNDILNSEEIELLVKKTIVNKFKKGTILLREGQIPRNCYMVVEGCVREYIIKDGEEISTNFFTECDTFTPVSLNSKPSKHYWKCIEDCILTISNKSYEQEIRAAIPKLDIVFQEMAIEKINKAREELSQFTSSSAKERYLHLLETKPELLNRVPLNQIASYLGIKPESLSRIRKKIIEQKEY